MNDLIKEGNWFLMADDPISADWTTHSDADLVKLCPIAAPMVEGEVPLFI